MPCRRLWSLAAAACLALSPALTACAGDDDGAAPADPPTRPPTDPPGDPPADPPGDPPGDPPADPPPDGPLVCNGHAELCDRRFDEVSFPATHNSMSSQQDGWTIPNQNFNLGRQLDDGIRAFLIDTHLYKGESLLCHEICKFGSLPLVDGLAIFRAFLETHPHEVITLIIEDHLPLPETEAAFEASGVLKYAFTHAPGDPWPTLREMITSGTRLFITAENGGPPPAWYHHVWDVTSDTPYTYKDVAAIEATGCDPNRGDVSSPLFLVNHWLSNPLSVPDNGPKTNPYEVLWPHVKACRDQRHRRPNFVAVDYYDVGDLFRVVDELNGF